MSSIFKHFKKRKSNAAESEKDQAVLSDTSSETLVDEGEQTQRPSDDDTPVDAAASQQDDKRTSADEPAKDKPTREDKTPDDEDKSEDTQNQPSAPHTDETATDETSLDEDDTAKDTLIDDAYRQWHDELAAQVDNQSHSLIDSAVVDLSQPHPTGVAQLFSGSPTRLTSLIREDNAQQVAIKRMEELTKRLADLENTYGYAPVTLAVGRLVWSEPSLVHGTAAVDSENNHSDNNDAPHDEPQDTAGKDDRRHIDEPAILHSVTLEADGQGDTYITLTSRCDINPVVLQALAAYSVPSEEISQLRALASDPAQSDDVIARLRELGRIYLPDFSYHVSTILGCFMRPASLLLTDLDVMENYIKDSGVMRALAGDSERRALTSQPIPPANSADRAPEAERGTGDCDVDELAVVEAIASGRSLVIDAPSGSNVTGTLASVAADSAASGNFVMYVPRRQSAGRAFIDTMNQLGLGELVLDLSNVDAAAHRLRKGMRQREPEIDDEAVLAMREQLVHARTRLHDYIEALHTVDEEWDESVHSLLQHMAELMIQDDAPGSRVRLPLEVITDLEENRDEISAILRDAAALGAFKAGDDASAWAGAPIENAQQGEEALSRAARLAKETIPVIMAQSHRVASETGMRRANSLNEWLEQITICDGIAGTLDVFVPSIYKSSAQSMVIATATKEWRESHNEHMSYAERRRWTKHAREYLRPNVDVADLHDALTKVQRLRDMWRTYCKEEAVPRLPEGLKQIKLSASEVVREIKALEKDLAPGTALEDMSLEHMLDTVRRLSDDALTMATLPRRNELVHALEERGFGELVNDFARRSVDAATVDAELDLVYFSSVFEQLVGRSPALAGIGPADLRQLADDVRVLDEEHVHTLSGPVNRAVIRHMREAISRKREETMKLDAQLEQYNAGALADAIAAYPHLVQASRPVWVVPPVLVAELIPPMPWADVVMMDGADSVSVSESVAALMRGRQIAIVGDSRRADDNSVISQFADVFPVLELPTVRAHHDDFTVTILREQGYDDVLDMIPAARSASTARLVLVDGRGVPSPTSGMVEGTQAEVDAVVDAAVEHILTKPEKTLAIVCVSAYHADRVREALRATVRDSMMLQHFVDADEREPFVILDVTQCAGLRRDCVIVSVGFGKTAHGRVLHNFGALAQKSGVTGLVDAIEAARDELTIVSCIGPGEINLDTVNSPGARLLAQVIERADGAQASIMPSEQKEDIPPLVSDLASRIEQAGWKTTYNYGYEDGIRIPLVAGSDDFDGTWRIAVLLDDDDYVNEPSLRRRDRYWIERLEERGWIVFRTFSTSLFIDPVGQANAVCALLDNVAHESVSEEEESPALAEGWKDTLREEASHITKRGPRPTIQSGMPLSAYSDDELDEIVTWIASDSRRRSEDQLVQCLREELGVNRRGAQIDAVLRNVVRRSGLASDDISSVLSAQSAPLAASDVPASPHSDDMVTDTADDATDTDETTRTQSTGVEVSDDSFELDDDDVFSEDKETK